MRKLHSKEDCSIYRDDEQGDAHLLDEEGDIIFSFDGTWTDEQIFHALAFANAACGTGFDRGSDAKAREILKLLGISK